MRKLSRRQKEIRKKVDKPIYSNLEEAIKILKKHLQQNLLKA